MTEARRGYVICTMPRSGSTYLCELLTSTGVLGRPSEYLNPDHMQALGMNPFPDDPRARLRQALLLGSTENGVYGLKVFTAQFDYLSYPNWLYDLPNVAFIYLLREDILGQAVSYVRAQQTHEWGTSAPSVDCSPETNYDESAIQSCLNELVLDEARWRSFFARNDLLPLRISYEAFVREPQVVLSAISSMLGVDEEARINPTRLRLKVQRGCETLELRRRFVRENADLSYLDSVNVPVPLRYAETTDDEGSIFGEAGKVIVWGAGMAARTTIAQRFDLSSIECFIDADVKKQGDTCLGLRIHPPQLLLEKKNCVIIVGSVKHDRDIRRRISQQFSDHVRKVVSLNDLLPPEGVRWKHWVSTGSRGTITGTQSS